MSSNNTPPSPSEGAIQPRGTNIKFGHALFGMSMDQGYWPGDQAAFTGHPTPIQYGYLDAETLDRLEVLGVPARSAQPFACNWAAIEVEFHAGKSPHFSAWLSDMVYQEWALKQWRDSLPSFIIDHVQRVRLLNQATMQFVGEEGNYGIFGDDLPAKWWLDLLAHRVVAVWNKIPAALCQLSTPSVDLANLVSQGERLDALKKVRAKMQRPERQLRLYDLIITNADENHPDRADFKQVRLMRNGDLHQNTQGFGAVFSKLGKRPPIFELADLLWREHARAREGIMTTIALMLEA